MIPRYRVAYKNKILGEVELIDFIDETVTVPVFNSETGEYLAGYELGLNQVTLMQSTGLFDKNGKEVFEGDVIRVNYTDDDSPWTDSIIWSLKDCAWYLKSNKELLGFAIDEPNIIVEVIGNIYENPELLEATND